MSTATYWEISDYNYKERLHYIKGSVHRHSQMVEEVETGIRVNLYRTRSEILSAKEVKGGQSASTWSLGGNVSSTLMCQATPGGTLASMLRQKLGQTPDGNTRLVMEEAGVPVSMGLKRNNPIKAEGWRFDDGECMVDTKGDCSNLRSRYMIRCQKCSKVPMDPKSNFRQPGALYIALYIRVKDSHYRCFIHIYRMGETTDFTCWWEEILSLLF